MNTTLVHFLDANKNVILQQWLDSTLAIFPERMGSGTPVSEVFSVALEKILSELDNCDNNCRTALDDVTRILAIQTFQPSKALSMFLELKKILRQMMRKSNVADISIQEDVFSRIDLLILDAFDSYMSHREKIYQLKVEEGKRRVFMALRRVEA